MTQPPSHDNGRYPGGPVAVCSWHPDRATGLRCTRCGRPACPECLTDASVGAQCRQCVAEQRTPAQKRAMTVAGSPLGVPPLIATVLIAINVVVYVVTVIQARSTDQLDASPVFFHGALIPVQVGQGEYWRVISSGFLHLGIIHIAANMISLYFLGPPLERLIGRWRFAVVYLVSLLGGSAAVMLFSGTLSMTVGASGAIFGLMGALVVTFKRMRYDLRQLAFILALNLFVTFQFSGISWQGHVGGLIAGALIGAAMVLPKPAKRLQIQIGAALALVVICVGLIVFKAGTEPDQSCLYLEHGASGAGIYCTVV